MAAAVEPAAAACTPSADKRPFPSHPPSRNQDEHGFARVPRALVAAATTMREAVAGSWSASLEFEIGAFSALARAGLPSGRFWPRASDVWLGAAEVRGETVGHGRHGGMGCVGSMSSMPATLSNCLHNVRPFEEFLASAMLLPQGIVAADARLVELLVGMAQEQSDAAAGPPPAAAAEIQAIAVQGEGSSSEREGSSGDEEGSGVAVAAGDTDEGGPAWGDSRLAAACLLLRSMARSAYITGKAEPATAFLRRFTQLAGTEGAWFAQLLLHPVLLLLSQAVSPLPLVREYQWPR